MFTELSFVGEPTSVCMCALVVLGERQDPVLLIKGCFCTGSPGPGPEPILQEGVYGILRGSTGKERQEQDPHCDSNRRLVAARRIVITRM